MLFVKHVGKCLYEWTEKYYGSVHITIRGKSRFRKNRHIGVCFTTHSEARDEFLRLLARAQADMTSRKCRKSKPGRSLRVLDEKEMGLFAKRKGSDSILTVNPAMKKPTGRRELGKAIELSLRSFL